MSERLRWKLWGLATRSRRVCPFNAHAAIWGYRDRGLWVDRSCRRDCADNGACYCGNLRTPASEVPDE